MEEREYLDVAGTEAAARCDDDLVGPLLGRANIWPISVRVSFVSKLVSKQNQNLLFYMEHKKEPNC
jgi:hypothetical protein